MKMFIFICFIVTLVEATAIRCANYHLEVTCIDGICKSSDSFTPINLSILDTGSTEVCLYTGCFHAHIKPYIKSHVSLYASKRFQSQSNKNDVKSFNILVNTEERIAMIQGEGFAMPLECETP